MFVTGKGRKYARKTFYKRLFLALFSKTFYKKGFWKHVRLSAKRNKSAPTPNRGAFSVTHIFRIREKASETYNTEETPPLSSSREACRPKDLSGST